MIKEDRKSISPFKHAVSVLNVCCYFYFLKIIKLAPADDVWCHSYNKVRPEAGKLKEKSYPGLLTASDCLLARVLSQCVYMPDGSYHLN